MAGKKPVGAIRKFTFDNDFDAPKPVAAKPAPEVVVEEELPPPPPPAPTFSEAEMAAAVDEARKAALAEGQTKGKADASAQTERQTASALAAIAAHFAKIDGEVQKAVAAVSETSVEVSLAMVRRLFPALAEQHGLDEVKTLLGRSLETLRAEPRFTVRVAESQAEQLQGDVDTLARSRGFEGRIMVTADAALKPGDCRIEWSQGGMIRSADAIWKAIETAMEQAAISTGDTSAQTAAD